MYVLLELLLRPPFGVGILLPTLGAEVPDFDGAGPFPAVETELYKRSSSDPHVGCSPHSDSVNAGRTHTRTDTPSPQWQPERDDKGH